MRSFVLIGLFLTTSLAYGKSGAEPTGSITGQVVELPDNRPTIGYWVEIEELGTGILTDSLGHFSFAGLKPGTYHLTVTGVGRGIYQDLPGMEVQVIEGQAVSTRIELPLKKSGTANYDRDAGLGAAKSDIISRMVEPRAAPKEQSAAEKSSRVRISGGDYVPTAQAPAVNSMPPYPCSNEQKVSRFRPNGYDSYEETEGPHDMYFRDYGTSDFVDPRRDRLSTFALDVDDASYNLAKEYLERGQLPPGAVVRLEEFVNHFDYGYNPPQDEKFRIFAELTPSPFDSEIIMLKLGIKGREVDRSERKPVNLTLVIDESGSMAEGNRLGLVKQAVRTLIAQLDRDDRVGVVTYNSQPRVVLDPIPADRRSDIMRALNSLAPGGRTYAEAGIELGYRMAGEQFVNGHSNQVVLFSDGVANVGRTGPDEIMNQIRRFAKSGISLHTYGVGMGNYNDALLEQLAQKGNGHYAYINSADEIPALFVNGFVAGTELLGRDVKVQVEFNSRIVKAYRLLGYENRDIPDVRFRDNRQDGGEVGAGHEVTALYELKLGRSQGDGKLADLFVRWKDSDGIEVSETSRAITLKDQFQSLERSRPELRLALVSARFAELLKGTVDPSDDAYRALLRLAEPLQKELKGNQTTELVSLIRTAWSLSGGHDRWNEEDYFSDNYRR